MGKKSLIVSLVILDLLGPMVLLLCSCVRVGVSDGVVDITV
jgi:hypothetical protein